MTLNEGIVEQAAIEWLKELGYSYVHGPDIAPGEPAAERASYAQIVLVDRLRTAIARLNPRLPASAIDEAVRKVLLAESPSLLENNRRFHQLLTDGVPVEYQQADGRIAGDIARLCDLERPQNNEYLAVNQFTIVEQRRNRRPDIVLFINGLPLVVLELKNPGDEHATLKGAFNQLQTYKHDISSLFHYNAMLMISDGHQARLGSLTADWERFMPWKTLDGASIAPSSAPELEVLIKGVCDPRRLLDLIANFTVFQVDGATIVKKLAAYHQYHAVNKAVASTVEATGPNGDQRAGVIWHTQGSGKSLSMVFYAGKLIRHPRMANPTLVVLTDRNDLDDQLFGTFAACQHLLRQTPVQAKDRDHLQALLQVASGGVIFTTIQKFFPERGSDYPELSNRKNIVVIADEAHRSQYGFRAHLIKKGQEEEAYMAYGFAKYLRDALPHASFIGFTGTPVEASDHSTPAVFGDYIDIYDIQRAVEDGATVRIYYESRLAQLNLDEQERPRIDPDFEELTEGEEAELKEKLKSKWARLEAMVGSSRRIGLIARDLVEHFERRREALEGKGMIVCMSRRICIDLYAAIVSLRPEWHADDDKQGAIKVVMTGSAADEPHWQQHIRNKARRDALAQRLKDPDDPLKLVIVRDMWLTGFDAPCLHTMYADKPMKGHGLMQAIARVNRVFRDKPGGLIVDYLGLADQLRMALSAYTAGDRDQTGIPQEEAVAIMIEKHELVQSLFHDFDYLSFFSSTPAQRLQRFSAATDFIAQREHPERKKRFIEATTALGQAFALAVPHPEALAIRDHVGFFQAIRSALVKAGTRTGRSEEDLDSAVRQLVSRVVVADGVVDIFTAAGLPKPEVSILSDEFLEEVRNLEHRNLALELMQRLLNDAINVRARKNDVQARSFAEMLDRAMRQYQNRAIETAHILNELIAIAKEMRAAQQRGEQLGLNEDEEAFYDALAVNDGAVAVLGDAQLRIIARELVQIVRKNVTIDWTLKESARAHLRRLVKRILNKYGYPPDKQERATMMVLEQAEQLGRD